MDKISVGNCGEYFAAGELERRDFTCAVPMSNTKNFDILAINRKNNNQYAIQVKTSSGRSKKWVLGKKNEDLKGNNIVYIFISLNNLGAPEYHIVPSEIVAERIKKEHKAWIKKSGRNGEMHKDSNMRHFSDYDDKYLNYWNYLK